MTDQEFLTNSGEMGALMRTLDWSSSPLGPIEAWPQSLRTAISICLMSRFPMAVCWGPSFAIVYNDAYRPILGTKHPWAMGRPTFEVWSELAHIVQPMFDGVIASGDATWSDDLMLPMLRHGYLEEAYFTVSYSAIRGESSRPEGVFVTVTETTARYLAERRLRLVRELGEASSSARSPEQVADLTASMLARHIADVPFSLLYLLDPEAGQARLAAVTGIGRDHPAAPAAIPLVDAAARPWPIARLLAANAAVVVDDLSGAGELPGGIWPEPARAAVMLPVPGPAGGAPIAALVAGVNPRRALDARHHEFFGLVAAQIANAMANAIAHEETRRRADALAEIDRAKTAFFSNVSHEFRTPLTLMLGPLHDVLAESETLADGDRDRLEVAHRNSLRLLKLVNTLLDFSRLEAGRLQASYEPTDLAALTSELASLFRSAMERGGLRLRVTCAPLPDDVYVDRELWEKIVFNLLSNAFKFTFEGEIEVSLRAAGDAVELSVRDTGTGIPASELPHLFERFHRVRNARSRTFEGSGIGLALVQELVKLHGGTVRVASKVDRGSTFTVSVPRGSAHLPPDRLGAGRAGASTPPIGEAYVEEALRWLPPDPPDLAAEAADPAAEGAPRARILVADDNADMRDYVRRLLGGRYDVEEVGDGEAALARLRERAFDVVLADVMMPGLDGFALLSALRADPATSDTPVILLSARAGEEARVEGLAAGADDYLVKPFTARELAARIAGTLRLTQLRRRGEERLAEANRELSRRVTELQTLLDVLPVGIGIAADRECRDISINRAFASTLGLPSTANASKTAPPDQRPTNFRVLDADGREVPDDRLPMQLAAREGREVRDLEYDVVHSDGRVVRLLEYAAPLYDEQGTPRGAVGAFIDVTAGHQAKRRDQFLARLDETTRGVTEPAAIADCFCRLLADELHADRVEISAIGGGAAIVCGGYRSEAAPDLPPLDAGERERLARGEAVLAGVDAAMPVDGQRRRMSMVVPLLVEGRLAATLAVSRESPIPWTEAEVAVATHVGRRGWEWVERARVTRTLSESEERYRRIFDTAGVSLWEEDFTAVKAALDELTAAGVSDFERYFAEHPDFVQRCVRLVRIVDVNEATLRMFAAPDKTALLESLANIFDQRTGDVFVGELLALVRGESRFEAEAALRTLDGRLLHTLLTVTFPVPPASYRSVLVSLSDITERKRAETALRQSEHLFREMADTSPVMLWTTDPTGRCTYLSRGWYEFTGQTPETGLGYGWINAVHEDDRQAAGDAFVAANARQEAFRLEYRLRRVDGAYHWAIDAARPRFDESGAFLGYIGAVFDISDRKTAETALQEEVSIRTTLAQVGAALAGELDTDKLVQLVTDAGTKLTTAEFGAFFYNTVDDRGDAYQLYALSGAPREAFASFPHPRATEVFGPTFRGEGTIRLDDVTADPRYGRNRPYKGMPAGHLPVRSYLAVPVVGRGGEVFGGLFFGHSQVGVFSGRHEQLASGVAAWAAIALDNARLYRDVERASRLKDEFLATLSHELRTPLNAVLGWAHMLRSGSMAPTIRQRALESLERNAKAQAQLVEDLLDVSRIISGKLQIKAEPVDLTTVVHNAIDTVRPAAAAKRVDLVVDVDRQTRVLVTGDVDRLQQIVWNLLSNAIKFTPGGGRVDVGLRRSESKAQIVVKDTGQGIAPSFQPQLFQRFQQSDSSTARKHGGLGLGLSIVRHLTEAHGGKVEAESPGEGRGATFTVQLPVRAVEQFAAPEPAAAAGLAATGRTLQGASALVVDDEADARELIRYVLETRGARVTTAGSAGEALHLFGRERFDVLLADIGMPEQDGYSLIRVVRGMPAEQGGGIPAIAVTAYASMRERDQALEAGFNWHLAKPVDPDELLAAVSAVIEAEPRNA